MTRKIEICEVGPRDGLQNEDRVWSVDERIELINRLSGTGVSRIEAVSFVNPKRVPQMADADAVMAGIERQPGCRYAGLALNARGIERAIESGVDEVRFAVVASETFSRRNQGASIAETIAQLGSMVPRIDDAGLKLGVTIAAAFGCPFEGEVDQDTVTGIAGKLAAMGVDEIGLADTIGSGVPSQVRELFRAVRDAAGADTPIGGHFHNTRNTGYANAVAAVETGAAFLDSSLGGIGGCPFAPRATGNIASEDLSFMLRNMGYETGVDLDKLIATANWVEQKFDREIPGQIMKAGLFPEVATPPEPAA